MCRAPTEDRFKIGPADDRFRKRKVVVVAWSPRGPILAAKAMPCKNGTEPALVRSPGSHRACASQTEPHTVELPRRRRGEGGVPKRGAEGGGAVQIWEAQALFKKTNARRRVEASPKAGTGKPTRHSSNWKNTSEGILALGTRPKRLPAKGLGSNVVGAGCGGR